MYLYFVQIWELREPEKIPPMPGKTIDVLLPTYNEDAELLRGSIVALREMDYPHKTYVLDDGNRPEIKALAEELGVNYIARKDNLFNKAGNLNNALDQTDGEFVVILDADHIAKPDFISRTLGYFEDEKMAFVQTPHAFYNFENFQGVVDYKKGVYWEEGQLFYNAIQPGKTHWNANVFCGSAAIFRRTALEDVGLIATETITEDIQTGLRMHARGWKSTYVNERLIAAQAAPDITTFTSQRLRWGEGNLSLFAYDNPLTVRGLTLGQRLNYMGSILGWTTGLVKVALYLTPILMLFTGIAPVGSFTWTLGGITAFYLISIWAAVKIASNGVGRLWSIEVQAMANFWLQCVAVFRAIVRRGRGKFVVTKKRGMQTESGIQWVYPHMILIALGASAICWSMGKILLGVSNDYIGLTVGSILILIQSMLAFKVIRKALKPAEQRFSWRHPVFDLHVFFSGTGKLDEFNGQGLALDINENGLGMIMYRPVAVGAKLKLKLTNPKRTVECEAEVRTCTELFPQSNMRAYRVGCKFVGLSNQVKNELWTLSSVESVNDHYKRLKDKQAYRFGYHRFPCNFEFENNDIATNGSAIVENMDLDSLTFNTQHDLDIFQNVSIQVDSAIGALLINGSVSKKELKEEDSTIPHFEYEVKIESFDQQSRSLLVSLTNSRAKSANLVSRPVPNRLREPIAAPAATTGFIALAASIACLIWCWNVWGTNYKVSVMARNEKVSKAEKEQINKLFDRVVENGPTVSDLPFLVNAKRTFETAGDPVRLNQASAAILMLQPENDGLTLYRANLLSEQGHFDEACELYEKLLAKEVVSSDLTLNTRLGAARCYVKSEDWASATEHFEVALNIDPENSDIAAELAWVFINLKQMDKVAEIFNDIPETHPDKDALYVQIEMRNGNFENAETRLIAMLAETPEDDSLKELLGDCYLSDGSYMSAKEVYLEIPSVDDDPEIASKLGTVYFLLDEHRDAVNTLVGSALLDKDAEDSEKGWVHFLLSAQKLETLPEIALARINEFEGRVISGEAMSSETIVQLAEVVAKHGDPSRAIDYFRRSVDQHPQHPQIRNWRKRLAELLQGEQRYKEADIEYQRLLTTRDVDRRRKFSARPLKEESPLKTSF